MSRILVRSIANIGKLVKNVRNIPMKSNTLISCNVKCVPSMMQSFGRRYATKAEHSLAEHLDKEIKLESEHFEAPANSIGQFNVKKLDGTDVELFRNYNNEKITIKFNINGILESEEMPKSDEEEYGILVSKPSFTVEVDKGREKNLVLELGFKSSEEVGEDGFDILSFATAKNGEVDKTIFSSYGGHMHKDAESYLNMMMKEIGVDQTLANELQEWATNYDKKLYLELLENLNKHVK